MHLLIYYLKKVLLMDPDPHNVIDGWAPILYATSLSLPKCIFRDAEFFPKKTEVKTDIIIYIASFDFRLIDRLFRSYCDWTGSHERESLGRIEAGVLLQVRWHSSE